MLADWHAHYPMRVVSDLTPRTSLDQMRRMRGRPKFRDRLRALVLSVASRIGSHASPIDDYRVTPGTLCEGNVGLAFSVLLRPLDEMDLSKPYGAPPEAGYFDDLLKDLKEVEDDVAARNRNRIRFVHDRDQLDEAVADGATALVHCVEGGFHLGNTDAEIADNCAELKRKGVAYVTVAHLFFRDVATNAPAIPFISDSLYNKLFPQQGKGPLTDRGKAVVRALADNNILIDLSHMDPATIHATLDLLDEVDGEKKMPVVSTHAGYRFGKQQYMHDDATLRRIAERDGLVGLIMAQHQLNDGLRKKRNPTKTLDESLEVICKHIDKIAEVTGSDENIALGTDFDGFIKPTMGGLESSADLRFLEEALHERYGKRKAELITWKNSLRVLEALWPE